MILYKSLRLKKKNIAVNICFERYLVGSYVFNLQIKSQNFKWR